MSLGYSGYATINGTQFLVTSLSAPLNEVRLDSSAGWGGKIVSNRTGMWTPRVYDFSANDGSISFELSQNLTNVIRTIINNRSNPFSLFYQACSGSTCDMGECWWTSISLTGSEGSPVTGDISFMAIERDNQTFGANYINNREGDRGCAAFGDIPSLNPGASNITPIPFWKTTFSGGPISGVEVTSWTLSLAQDVQKMFVCGASGREPVAPFQLGFGHMTAELQLELFIKPGNAWNYNRTPGSITIQLGDGHSIWLSELECQTMSQDIAGMNEIANVSVTYSAYNMAA